MNKFKSKQALISVIIPVYNVSHYLRVCLESVVSQTYKCLEIILVDDGSTDDSGKICDEYAKKDSRIVVIHKMNEGVSVARNTALKVAHGEYISFIDSDDFVDLDFINKLYNGLIQNDVDIAICGYEKIGGIDLATGKFNTKYKVEKILLPNSGKINKEELWFHTIDSNIIGCYLCNKLFKKDLLDKEGQNKDLCVGEDMVYLAQYLRKVSSAYYIAEPLYKYQMNDTSALNMINSTCNNEHKIRKIVSAIESTELLETIMIDETDEIRRYVSYRRIRSAVWGMYKLILFDLKEKEILTELRRIVKKNYRNYRKVRYGSLMQNAVVKGMYVSPVVVFYCGKLFRYMFPSVLYDLSRK